MDALERALFGGEGDAAAFDLPVDRALAAGAQADRLGYAFAAGYTAALQALVPGLGATVQASLAATEDLGAHPKHIRTTLTPDGDGFRVNGHKRWVTLTGTELYVLAKAGERPDGKAALRLVRVPRERAGVTVAQMPPPPFVPEIVHAELKLEDVRVEARDVLPGDGWEDWVKPFRTVEDIHVHAALLGYLLGAGRRYGWPRPVREQLAALASALRDLASRPPSSPAIHLALSGVIGQSREVLERLEPLWPSADAEERERWERDRPLLQVAGKARAARTEKAWSR